MRKRVHFYRKGGTDILGENFTQTAPTGAIYFRLYLLGQPRKTFRAQNSWNY